MAGQKVILEVRWASPELHCPVCGDVIFSKQGSINPYPCAHLLFTYVSDRRDWDFLSPRMKNLLGELRLSPASPGFAPWRSPLLGSLRSNDVVLCLQLPGPAEEKPPCTVAVGIHFPIGA